MEQYYYAPHRRAWGIWKLSKHAGGMELGEFIRDCPSKEEARKEVYRLNNWKYKPLSL